VHTGGYPALPAEASRYLHTSQHPEDVSVFCLCGEAELKNIETTLEESDNAKAARGMKKKGRSETRHMKFDSGYGEICGC
jgi:hypothetical protein